MLHLAAEGKIKYLDCVNEHRLHDAIASDLKRIREADAEKAKKEKFYAGQIVRRNPKRVKGEVRKKKTKVIGFRE